MMRPITLKNAAVWNGKHAEKRDLHFAEVVMDSPPAHPVVVDLDGYTVFPGLVNAHDHLELNHYPRTKFREFYDNAHQWGEDVDARLDTEPYKSLRAYPLWDRCFIGGLKNLLCGAITVAHHGPPHKPLFRKDFPVRVLKDYGWAHSLHFNTDAEVVESYRKTPRDCPWFIHLAEGTDETARNEYWRLEALGCTELNKTVIVHATALFLNPQCFRPGNNRGIVICPSTNAYLLGADAVPPLDNLSTLNANALGIGSDSRLTATGDLLDELRFAFELVDETYAVMLTTLVLYDPGFILFHQSNQDWLREQHFADFIMIHATENDAVTLCTSSRKDIQLIIRGGVPQIGNPDLMAKFPHIETVPATLDGVEKAINIDLARQIARCKLDEPGLELAPIPKRWQIF